MPRPKRQQLEDGRLWCPGCSTYLHNSRFSPKRQTDHGGVVQFHAQCRVCEQSARDDQKNADPATQLIIKRAASHAKHWDVTRDYLLYDLGWLDYLHDWVEAALAGSNKCVGCRHPFKGPGDLQIDIREPLRHPGDTARMDVRNVGPLCASCNNRKHDKSYAAWLDEEDVARRSVASRYAKQTAEQLATHEQPALF